jgi:hypothetical protein
MNENEFEVDEEAGEFPMPEASFPSGNVRDVFLGRDKIRRQQETAVDGSKAMADLIRTMIDATRTLPIRSGVNHKMLDGKFIVIYKDAKSRVWVNYKDTDGKWTKRLEVKNY